MTLAKSLERVASNVIAKFGGDVTIRYVSAGDYDVTAGAITETTTDIALKGVLEDVNVREANQLIQASDKRLTVAANDLATVPGTKDRVVIKNVVHQVVSVNTTEQDNTPITYELILRA